jgi:hypothetical protein
MKHIRTALSVCAGVCLCASVSTASTISVAAGGDLQGAINNAQPGDTIALARGATFTGGFVLPNKGGSTTITIRTAGDDGLPTDGGRITPQNAAQLARIKSNGGPAFQTQPGAHHWKLMLLEIAGVGGNDLVLLGDGSGAQSQLSQVPHDLVVDRVYIHGDATNGQKRGIALNSASTTITGSYISDIKQVQQDSQAICGWNGPGPYTITNNYLEAAGENILFGGSDPFIKNLTPADITIAGNLVMKQTAWRTQNWSVKNLIEFKNARRVQVVGNNFAYNWQGGQPGYAVLFTPRNQDGGCPWCQVDHINFEQNIVQHSSAGINILGADYNNPSLQTQALVIRNNLFADIDSQNWGGNGYFAQITGGPRDITIDHNTIISDHGSGVLLLDGAMIQQFTLTNNVAKANAYGIIGTSHGVGNDSIGAFLPASTIRQNVLAGGSAGSYPGGNSFPTVDQFQAQFVSYSSGDYRLTAASPWRGAGLDGLDLGAVFGAAPTSASGPAPSAAQASSTASDSAPAPSQRHTPDSPSDIVGTATPR